MPAEGGPARRLTWLGTDTLVRGWTPRRRDRLRHHPGPAVLPQPPRASPSTPPAARRGRCPGARSTTSPSVRASAMVIGRNTADPARWKRYRGGTAGALWIDAEGSGTFRRMNELAGNVTSPMWIDDRVYFLGDGEGVGNLYSCRPDGSDLRRHTDHDDFYARHAQTDGRRIVYQCGAKIWLFDPAQRAATARSTIRTPAHRTQAARKFVAGGRAPRVVPRCIRPATALALVARGQLFAHGALGRRARASYGRRRRPRAMRHGQWLGDGSTLVAVSDASGEERVVAFAGHERQAPLPWDIGHVIAHARRAAAAAWSPSPTIATRSGSATSTAASCTPSTRSDARAQRRSRLVARRRLARLHLRRRHRATARSSCTRSRRTPARSSPSPSSATTSPVVRSRRQVPLLPVAAHLRPGLRQRPVRAQLPARGAALPDRAAGRRPAAVRADAARA